MDEIEQFKSIWIGKQFISIGETRVKGNQYQFKRQGGLPFAGFVPVLANADQIPYQERIIWHPGTGDTGIRVRIFMADLRMDKYFAMINPQDLNAINHLKRENESLHQEIERLFEMLYDVSNEDRWKKRIKKEIENYNAIKGYGYGGGSYGGSYNSPSMFPSGEENFSSPIGQNL